MNIYYTWAEFSPKVCLSYSLKKGVRLYWTTLQDFVTTHSKDKKDETRRKNAHCTKMLAIMITSHEKQPT